MRSRFARNLGWLGAGQLASRAFRLLATVIVARVLLPEDYGLAAIVLTAHELAGVLVRRATFTRLVQAPAPDLGTLSASAYTLNWILGATLFALQCAAAPLVGRAYDAPALVAPIAVLALTHLLLPAGMVQAARNVRAGRLHVSAKVESVQSLLDCLLTVLLALAGAGVWALVLPKLLVAPIWVVMHRRHSAWRPHRVLAASRWRDLARYGCPVVGVDVLRVVRGNADYVLVGHFLGVEALGVYFFAFNAGLGISLGVMGAFSTALLPHLCACAGDRSRLRARFTGALRSGFAIVAPLVLAQSVLAPLYVPVVFGERWVAHGAVPVLALVCLSAIPRVLAETTSLLLQSAGRPAVDLGCNAGYTAVFCAALCVAARLDVLAVAATVLAVQAAALPVVMALGLRAVFGRPGNRSHPAPQRGFERAPGAGALGVPSAAAAE